QLKIVPQRELHAARISRAEDLAEEWAEVGKGTGDAPIRVIECVEALRTELNGMALTHAEAALESEIEKVVAWSWDRVTTRVPEREGCGRGECGRVKEVIARALSPWEVHALTWNTIGTIRRARIGEIEREVEGVDRCAVL